MRRPWIYAAALAASAVPFVGMTPVAAGGGCHRTMDGKPDEAGGVTVELVQNCMSPMVLHTDVGATVTFVNRDSILHNVTGSGMFEELNSGQSFTRRFSDAGTYPFSCTLHPGMNGALVVGSGAAGAVTPASIDAEPARVTSSTADTGSATLAFAIGAVTAAVAGSGGYAIGRRRTRP